MADLSRLTETRSTSALFKRAEQLRRWEESETNRECSALKDKPRKLKFTDECIFLAACSAGDKDEVKRLLAKGAYINTGNVDGLTALHQACIDDNLDMVEFLVENGADVNCGDNEGWTPLHATASCGFVSIAKYLIENGASVAAVNNDGELPLDIAETGDMEEFLQQEIDNEGIDCDSARNREEHLMLEDANKMLNSEEIIENRHPKTGATALHVAAAKGYIKVMSLLLQAGLDINAQDLDGWTALHAAAHWGQKESCKLLVENFCNMEIRNFSGQTAFDIADAEIDKILEELKKRQISLIKEREKEKPPIQSILDNVTSTKRRSSVTRMSVADKTNVINKDKTQERAQIETTILQDKSTPNPPVCSSETETEESSEESTSEDSEVGSEESSDSSDLSSEHSFEKKNKANKVESSHEVISAQEPIEVAAKDHVKNREPPAQAPALFVSKSHDDSEEVPSWRRGMAVRKPGTSANASESINQNEDEEVILRSKPANEKDQTQETRKENRRPASVEITDERSLDRLTHLHSNEARQRQSLPVQFGMSKSNFSPSTNSRINVRSMVAAVELMKSAQEPPPRRERKVASEEPLMVTTQSAAITLPSALNNTSAVNASTPTTPSTPGTPTANMTVRRSFVPPVRDEESETQRKAHAKRVRETRRSTQGVTLEDLKSAEQLVQKKNTSPEEQKTNATPMPAVPSTPVEDRPDSRTGATVERRASWRVRLEQDDNAEDIESVRRSRDAESSVTATITLTTLTATTTTTAPLYTCRSRPNSISNASDVDTTVTVTLKARPSSRTQNDEDDLKDQDKENEKVPLNTQATQAAIQRRRRPKRRSTGVVYLDLDDGDTEKLDGDGRVDDRTENKDDAEEQSAIGDRGYRSSRYGSTSSLSESGSRAETPSRLSERSDKSERQSRAGSTTSTTSQNDTGEKDYKKLYEEQKSENERIKEKLLKTEQELHESRSQLDKAMQNNARNATTDAERREKRALERKLSEMEEELKLMQKLKAENDKLKAENRALTRVVSKLTK